jgi:predicted O-linked N-acetylglucosamine transferase (SPINDLY family)
VQSIEHGKVMHGQGRLAEAEAIYQAVLARRPRQFEALHLLALIRYQQGRLSEAHDLVSQAVKVRQDSPQAWSVMMAVLLALDRPAEALAVCDRVLAIDRQDINALFNRAFLLARQRRFEEALAAYDKVLARDGSSVDALFERGNVLAELSRFEDAIACYDRVLARTMGHVGALTNRGNSLAKLGRHADALLSYDRALSVHPNDVNALANRAIALNEIDRHDEALASCNRALAIDPNSIAALVTHGNILIKRLRYENALESFDKALAVKNDDVDALSNRGFVLLQLNRFDDALGCFDRVLGLEPDHAEALNRRGAALDRLKRHEEARASYEKALDIRPDYVAALINLGHMLLDQKKLEEALASYDKAIRINPKSADALVGRGCTLLALSRHDEALACYDQAIAVKPDFAIAFFERGVLFMQARQYDQALDNFRKALDMDPDHMFAAGHFVHSAMQICNWNDLSTHVQRVIAGVESGKCVAMPFVLLGISQSAYHQLRSAEIYVEKHVRTPARAPWHGTRYRHDRIRLAYISGDLRVHPVAILMAGLFERHDRSQFETFAISLRRSESDDMRRRLVGAFDQFIDVDRKSDQDVAGLLREMEIDIAVDLMGHTRESRPNIFAWRPAPIQVSYLGYAGSMGADFIDYVIADKLVLPLDQQVHYTEKIVHLPDCFLVNDSTRQVSPQVPSRAQAGLPERSLVFCCFNQSYKLSPAVFDVWMRLLGRIEGSVLWLSRFNDRAVVNLRDEARVRGVDPERLRFAARVPSLADHLARQKLADLFLDTFPYNAHSTASDALWAGVPVLTCAGATFAGRVAASLLHAVGLPELVACDLQEYEDLAFELAMNPVRLRAMRDKLETNPAGHPLFDTDRFRRHIEAAYRTMWEIWQRGEPPRAFGVPAS